MWDQQNLFELFVNIIPQTIAIILLYFALLNIKIEKVSFSLLTIVYSIIIFLIRPYVNFGVHTLIMLLFMSVVATIWGKANIISSVICGVITYTFAYLCEWFTFLLLEVYKFDMELLSNNPRIRAAIGFIPISMLFVIWLAVYYIKKNIKKKEEGKDAAVREDIQ